MDHGSRCAKRPEDLVVEKLKVVYALCMPAAHIAQIRVCRCKSHYMLKEETQRALSCDTVFPELAGIRTTMFIFKTLEKCVTDGSTIRA